MGIKQDVFGLEQIYRLQLEGNWSTKGDVWLKPLTSVPVGTDFGYFSGGRGSPGNISAILRLDFNNDTTTPDHRSNISDGSRYTQSVSSTSHLYVCGGNNTTRSKIDRLDFSNDTANATPRGLLNTNRVDGLQLLEIKVLDILLLVHGLVM